MKKLLLPAVLGLIVSANINANEPVDPMAATGATAETLTEQADTNLVDGLASDAADAKEKVESAPNMAKEKANDIVTDTTDSVKDPMAAPGATAETLTEQANTNLVDEVEEAVTD